MTQREEFEAWWGQAPVELQPLQPRTREDTLSAWVWEAWQAAQAGAEKAEPVLELLSQSYSNCITNWGPSNMADWIYRDLEELFKSPPVQAGEIRLWDTQWTNVVNHANAYAGWSIEDAVNHAVKMTEKYIAANVAQNKLPPQEAPKAEPPQYRAMWLKVKEELDLLKLRGGNGNAEPVTTTAPSEDSYSEPPHPMLTDGEIYTAYIKATNQTLRPQDERLAMAFARAIEAEVRG